MEIRLARPDEYDRIADVMVDAYRQYAETLPEHAWKEYEEDIRDIASRAPFADLLVADDGDEILGAVTYYRPGSGGGYGPEWPEGWPSFRLLAVPPVARGRGIGRLLTQACIDRARSDGAPGLALGTTKLMGVARAMYERMGFVHHPRYDWYPVPEVRVFIYLLAFDEGSTAARSSG